MNYYSFTCQDLTSNYSSADGPTSIAELTKQLQAATSELNAQEAQYASSKTYWDSCEWKDPKLKKKGYYNKGQYADSDCRREFDKMSAARTRISQLKTSIETLNNSIDKVGSKDPVVIKAQADANAALATSQAAASRTKLIGWTIAGVLVLAGITWAVVKFRKK